MTLLRRAVLIGLSIALGITLTPDPASAATGSTPAASYFGMHDSLIGQGEFPDAPVGSVRLWDTGTTWRDIETDRGVYEFTVLDEAVRQARSHGASVMMVLSGTPSWYAKEPWQPSIYGDGFCSMTNDLGAWRNYVTAVATRYKGRIKSYEPVNEGDILSFWCSSKDNLATMARVAYRAIKAVDPKAIVSSPSFVDRTPSSQHDIVDYLTVNHGARWADVISYHPYGMPSYGPEQNAWLVRVLRHKLAKHGITKPIWSTEVNYGLPFGNFKEELLPWPLARQAAFVTRTYLLQYDAGARRVYWYDWSAAPFLGVKMTTAATGSTGNAFSTVRWWMRGRFQGCEVHRIVEYTCTIAYKHGHGIVAWNTTTATKNIVPKGTYAAYNNFGRRLTVHHRMLVGLSPTLFRTRR